MIQINNLTKVFGQEEQRIAKQALAGGLDRATVREKYNHTLALANITMTIPEGSISVIMGLSGCGKSTLVRTINRLVEPTAGEIWVTDRNVCSLNPEELQLLRRFDVSMVFQHFGLFPHRTVLENVEFGPRMQNVASKTARERARHWIDTVGLAGCEASYPQQLSGGMQQRVGLARALATDSKIILMDEAFSALDPLMRCEMQDQLLMLQENLRKTIVFITHDLDEGIKLGSQIAILKDGKLVQIDSPAEIVNNPADDYVASFVKHVHRPSAMTQAREILTSSH